MKSVLDSNYELIIPDDFEKYISRVEGLLNYAKKVVFNPNTKNPTKGLEEIANLKRDLIKNRGDIERYLDSLHNKKVGDLSRLNESIDGMLFWVEGQIPNLKLELQNNYKGG